MRSWRGGIGNKRGEIGRKTINEELERRDK